MYSVLVVDDEKIIRDGVCELLKLEEVIELDVISAGSVNDALQLLESRMFDIIITDIRMPQLTGLDFFDVILKRWPRSRVIFLTGLSEFEYVYKVQNQAKYVLKSEGDEKIIAAVKETISEIENDLYINQTAHSNKMLTKVKNEIEFQLLVKDILNGYISADILTQTLLDKLDISLCINKETYYVVMQYRLSAAESYEDLLSFNDKLYELISKYYFENMCGVNILYTRNFGLLLLQEKTKTSNVWGSALLKSNSELFQRASIKNMEGSMSLNVGARPIAIKEAIQRFHLLRSELLIHDEEVFLFDDGNHANRRPQNNAPETWSDYLYSKTRIIDYFLENHDQGGIQNVIKEVRDFYRVSTNMQDVSITNLYMFVATKLISLFEQGDLGKQKDSKIDMFKMCNLSSFENWYAAFDYLLSVTNAIFEFWNYSSEKQNKSVVKRIKDYIQENLSRDTSLTTLADYVNLSPEYLLRLFKKKEGVTILSYTNELKVVKAKNLLRDSEKSIKDIAEGLGFMTTGSFSRFFKNKTGMSPQAWRESKQMIEAT